METLFSKINGAFRLPRPSKSFLEQNLQIKRVAKDEIIFQPGICHIDMAFIESGFLHTYHPFKADGPTNQFFVDGDLYLAPWLSVRPTQDIEYVQALQDTILYQLSYDLMQRGCEEHHDFCQLLTFLNLENRVREAVLIRLEDFDLEERYQFVIDHFDGGHTLHQQYIAFYLGLPAERIKALKRREYRRRSKLLKDKP